MEDELNTEYPSRPKRVLSSEAARRMGSAKTEAKRRAAIENGKLGGWKKGRPLSDETRRKISATKTLSMLRRVFGDATDK